MARRPFSRTNTYARLVPFGLFGGQMSGFVLLIVSLLIVVMSSLRPGWVDPVRRVTMNGLATPLTVFSVPFQLLDKMLGQFFLLTQVRAEAENLREENRRLQDWYNVAQLLKAENQSLRSLLKVRVNRSLSTMTVQVIGDTSGPYAQTILIDGGAQEQFSKGDAVLGGEGLIGRILQVYDKSSVVLLMTDLSSHIPVRIEGSTIQAILSGTGSHDVTLTHLPEGSQLNEGEQVVTSGIGGVFPPDLPVGTAHIRKNGRVDVVPFADFGRLLYVRVVRMQAYDDGARPEVGGLQPLSPVGSGSVPSQDTSVPLVPSGAPAVEGAEKSATPPEAGPPAGRTPDSANSAGRTPDSKVPVPTSIPVSPVSGGRP